MAGSMIRSSTSTARRATAALAVAVLGSLAACSSGDGDEVASTTLATIPLPSAPDRSDADTTAAPTTPAPTEPPTTPPPTTQPPTTPAPTEPPTTPAPTVPVTTEPLAVQELVLSGEGIGSAVFGADPDAVIDYVGSILGSDTADTGWVAPDTFRVDWGTLSLLFTDESFFATGRRHFIGYEYGRVGGIGDEPAGLRTEGGLTLGSRVIDLLAEFPDAVVITGDEALGFPDNFYVSDIFYGLLTGTTPDDYVTVLFGGYGCGE
jgi:hypothetical protein